MALNIATRQLPLPRAFFLLVIVLLNNALTSFSAPTESEVLIKFKDSLTNNGALSSWDPVKPPCPEGVWKGVICSNGNVWGLKLQNMGLKGALNMEILKDLPHLRTISVMGNEFEGEFPNLKAVTALKSVYLSDNKFSGEIKADALDGITGLKKFYAARNGFTGSIPESLTRLPLLTELMLENNAFTGPIPNFPQDRLTSFNVSGNQLDGPIPEKLTKLDATAFAGNDGLCGGPLPPCSSSSSSSYSPSSKTPAGIIVLVVLFVAAALAAIFVLINMIRHRKKIPEPEKLNSAGSTPVHSKGSSMDMDKMEKGIPPPAVDRSSTTAKNNNNNQTNVKLTFLRDDTVKFDLPDLLKASAEILGSGVFGSTFKAALGSIGQVMVVKRYKQMNNVGREEFQEHMRRIGRLKHTNLLPLVAFLYRKEEKLLVTEYINNPNLAVYLHGNRGRVPSLDWSKRVKIVKGIARGLLYLYNELPSIAAPHGHLKSANVLLNDSLEPLLNDYALSPIVNQEHAQELMMAYKSPEYKQQGRITKKTDVWSLGVLILEILTGRVPPNTTHHGKGNETDLATWVLSVAKEDWKDKVFDKDMGGKNNCEDEMMKLMEIGLRCCEPDVEKRLEIKEAVEKIEVIKE